MFTRSRCRASISAIALMLVLGCSSDGTPPPDSPGSSRSAEDLTVARLTDEAPSLEASTVSFWAVNGRAVEQRLYFLDAEGGRGEEYLSLSLEAGSLRSRPDGSVFAEGDSVLITITVEDTALLLFELEPTGLKFNANKQAKLRINYANADADLNGDGEIDSEDDHLEGVLGIWRQEELNRPFVRLGSVRVEEQTLEANLKGFSRYAIAY